MRTNDESKFSFLLIGLGLGVIGGMMAVLLARKETRESLNERSRKTIDYLNQQGKRLRDASERIVEKGKEFVSQRCCSGDAATEAKEQAYQEERRETPDG
jgi:gas vesicle protein